MPDFMFDSEADLLAYIVKEFVAILSGPDPDLLAVTVCTGRVGGQLKDFGAKNMQWDTNKADPSKRFEDGIQISLKKSRPTKVRRSATTLNLVWVCG
jgi:hypothetical protein